MNNDQKIQFILSKGTVCPSCGNVEYLDREVPKVEYGESCFHMEDGRIFVHSECSICNSRFIEEYTLTGVCPETES